MGLARGAGPENRAVDVQRVGRGVARRGALRVFLGRRRGLQVALLGNLIDELYRLLLGLVLPVGDISEDGNQDRWLGLGRFLGLVARVLGHQLGHRKGKLEEAIEKCRAILLAKPDAKPDAKPAAALLQALLEKQATPAV